MKNFRHILKESAKSTSFARKLGMSDARINELLNENIEPLYTELRKIAEISKLPLSFLLKEHDENNPVAILYRRQIGSVEQTIIENFNFYVNNILALNPEKQRVENIRENLPAVENTYINAEKLAYIFRQEYFDGNHFDPLTDLPQILSNKLNFIVKVFELGKSADGASAIIDGYTFLLISPRFEARMLFTLAHELAHVINHHREGDFVFFDKTFSLRPQNDNLKIEYFANAFASALLLPQDGVAQMLGQIRQLYQLGNNQFLSDFEILYLARFFGVSFDVASYRCEKLGLLPDGGAYALSSQIKNAHESAERRANELNIPEREQIIFPPAPDFLFKRALDLILQEEYSSGKAAEMLGTSVQTLLQYHSQIG